MSPEARWKPHRRRPSSRLPYAARRWQPVVEQRRLRTSTLPGALRRGDSSNGVDGELGSDLAAAELAEHRDTATEPYCRSICRASYIGYGVGARADLCDAQKRADSLKEVAKDAVVLHPGC